MSYAAAIGVIDSVEALLSQLVLVQTQEIIGRTTYIAVTRGRAAGYGAEKRPVDPLDAWSRMHVLGGVWVVRTDDTEDDFASVRRFATRAAADSYIRTETAKKHQPTFELYELVPTPQKRLSSVAPASAAAEAKAAAAAPPVTRRRAAWLAGAVTIIVIGGIGVYAWSRRKG